MTRLLLVMLSVAAAHAEPTQEVKSLTSAAHIVVRDGRCDALASLAVRIRALDAGYYQHVFAIDPMIAQGASHAVRPQQGVGRTRRDPS